MAASTSGRTLVQGEDDTIEWLVKATRYLLNLALEKDRKIECNDQTITPCAKRITDNEVSIAPCEPCGPNVGYPQIFSTPVASSKVDKSGRRGIVIVPCPPCGPNKDCAKPIKRSKPCPATVQWEPCYATCAVKLQNGTKFQKESNRTKSSLNYPSSSVSVSRKTISCKDFQSSPTGDETLSTYDSAFSSGGKYSEVKSPQKQNRQSAASTTSIAWSQPTTTGPTSAEFGSWQLPMSGIHGPISGRHNVVRKTKVAPDSGYTSVTNSPGQMKFSTFESQASSSHSEKHEQGITLNTLKSVCYEASRPGEKFRTCFPQYDKCPRNSPLPPWIDPDYKEPEPRAISPVYVPPEPSEPEFNPWHNTNSKEPYEELPNWQDGFPGGLPYDHMHMEFPTDESQEI